MIRQTNNNCLQVGQMPLCSCAVEIVWWDCCPVTCSPSCERLHRQTVDPCHHPPVSSLRRRVCLVGRTMAPSQLQAAPTPRKMWSQKGHKDPNNERRGLCHLGRIGRHFHCLKRLPEGWEKKHRKPQKIKKRFPIEAQFSGP